MSHERQQLEAAIRALESQRSVLGDDVVETAIAPLRAKLATLPSSDTSEPPAQSLKQVSILFLDIVASTALSQHLDPEEAYVVMHGALARFTAIVRAHGGKVLNYAGDSVLAIFGADGAREDDPERAVRAGLALLDEGRSQGEQIKQKHDHDGFNVRVGVHTGSVLLGEGVDAMNSAWGQALNVAARMEQSAPPGMLRISRETHRRVRGVFTVEPQPPLTIKGIDEPVATYLVLSPRPGAFRVAIRGIEGVETPMVGRDVEFGVLTAAFHAVLGGRSLAFIALVGDAGIGKSRLMGEFERWIEHRPEAVWLFRGRAQAQGLHQPYGVLRDLLFWRFDIQDSDSLQQAQAKLAQGVARVLGDEQTALLGQLIGLDYSESPHIAGILKDGKQLRQRAFRAAAQYLSHFAAHRREPVAILLEDLHWADESSLDFFEELAGGCSNLPMMIVCATRPTLFERRASWGQAVVASRRIDIGPLRLQHSREMADSLLRRIVDPPPVLLELLTAGAEGNPFYMEELMQMLIDDGAIRAGGEHWTVALERLREIHVPPTLTGVLQARIDSLPLPEKRTLQQASVIGHVFWDEALAQLHSEAPLSLPALGKRELTLGRDTSAFDGTREYVFRHHLLHQVTYDSVLRRHKKEQHRQTALWLTRRCAGRSGEYLGLIAEHFERAGDAELAAQYWARAADDALQRHAEDAAMAHADRVLALDHEGRDLRRRFTVMDVRQVIFAHRSALKEQAQVLDEMERLADTLDDDRLRSHAATRRARWFASACDWPATLHSAQQALEWAGSGASSEAAVAHGVASDALYRMDRRDAAREHCEAGLAQARAIGDKKAQSDALNNLGNIAMVSKALVEAGRLYEEAVALKLEIGDRFGAAISVGNVSILAVQLGQLERAREWQAQSLALARETGNRPIEASMHLTLAEVLISQDDPAAALQSAHEALAIVREIGDRRQEAETLTTCGDASMSQSDWSAAAAYFKAARDLFSEIDMPYWAQMSAAGLASALLSGGDIAAALAQVEIILARLAAGVGAADKCGVLLESYFVLKAARDSRACEVLTDAHSELQRMLAQIEDAQQREAFLGRATHRKVLAEWAERDRAASGDQRPA